MTIKLANGTKLRAATCPKCGARIYPPSELKAHKRRHVVIYEPVPIRKDRAKRFQESWAMWQTGPGFKS